MKEMSPEDRRTARVALERGWLTIDDVAACKDGVEKTGLPFVDVARAKGLLTPDRVRELAPPPPPSPPAARRPFRIPLFYAILLVLAGAILIGSEVYFRIRAGREDDRIEREAAEMRRRADEAARAAADRTRQESRERERKAAADHLRQARILLTRVEEVLGRNPRENLDSELREATQRYTLYLQVFPEDADALFERSLIHVYRGALEPADKDLESACTLAPARAAEFRRRSSDLRNRFNKNHR